MKKRLPAHKKKLSSRYEIREPTVRPLGQSRGHVWIYGIWSLSFSSMSFLEKYTICLVALVSAKANKKVSTDESKKVTIKGKSTVRHIGPPKPQ